MVGSELLEFTLNSSNWSWSRSERAPDRIKQKFQRLSEPVLGLAKTQRLLEAVLDIEKHSAREIVDRTMPD